MNIFDAGGEARDLDEVAPHAPGHVGKIRDGRDDPDLPRPGGVRGEQSHDGQDNDEETLHRTSSTAEQTSRTMLESQDRKSTRLNSSHRCISYAVFCYK